MHYTVPCYLYSSYVPLDLVCLSSGWLLVKGAFLPGFYAFISNLGSKYLQATFTEDIVVISLL